MNALHSALLAAHAALLEIGDDENADQIENAIEMFAPHPGDSAELAKTRNLDMAHCHNCDLSWPAMATPAPVMKVALTVQRLAKCPRCFSTEDIFIRQTKS